MKITEDKLSQSQTKTFEPFDTFSTIDSFETVEQALQALSEEEHCPACLEVLPKKAGECPSCRVDIINFKRVALEKRMKALVPGIIHLSSFECQELDQAWRKVEGLYIDSETHHQFLHLCYRLTAMSFAVKKYSERLEKNPLDETAEMMRKQAVVLVHESVQARSSSAMTPAPSSDMQYSFMRLFNYIMTFCLIGGIVILMVSALTQNKLFFFGLGFFLCLSSVMTMLFLKREMV